jgi:winged helix DNA-binding protein
VNAALKITRAQILAYRRTVQGLDKRLPAGADSLRSAAWAGLQDSVPRAALHALHARVESIAPSDWENPALVQVWGLRYTAYVVPAGDHAIYTLARLPDRGKIRERAFELAARLDAYAEGRRVNSKDVAEALGDHPNNLRYATLTGTVLIRWDGARRPTVWTAPTPDLDPREARAELIRRYLHVGGPSTAAAFAIWAGVSGDAAHAAFVALSGELTPVATPIGDAWILTSDAAALRAPVQRPTAVRLLPSGDPYYLLQGADRELLVPDPASRTLLWTPRVWPGGLLVDGEIVGTWRRDRATVTLQPWQALLPAQRRTVEQEARSIPLPDIGAKVDVRWDESLL